MNLFGKKPAPRIPSPPSTKVSADMEWIWRGERWVIHFAYGGEDFWFFPGEFSTDQYEVDALCLALRSSAYRSQGLPPPPHPLSKEDPLRFQCSRSNFFIKWEWSGDWVLSLYALDHVRDRPLFFQCFHGSLGVWSLSDFDFAIQSMYATMDQARALGWR